MNVDHGSIEYEVIGKICDQIPIIAGSEGSVSQTKRGDSLGVERTKLTIRCGLAGVVGHCIEGVACTHRVEAGGSLKLIGDILPRKFGRQCLDGGVARLGRIEHEVPTATKPGVVPTLMNWATVPSLVCGQRMRWSPTVMKPTVPQGRTMLSRE